MPITQETPLVCEKIYDTAEGSALRHYTITNNIYYGIQK